MRRTGRVGPGRARAMPRAHTNRAIKATNVWRFVIEIFLPFRRALNYPIAPSSARPATERPPKIDSRHAVLDLSPRAYGLDPAQAGRTVRRRLPCRAHVHLHGWQV